MASTGCSNLDNFFIYPNAISCIYGKPATGKTTLCLLAASAEKGRVIFIDTENSFSVERIKQINNTLPDNIFLINVKNFKEQCKAVENLLNLKKQAALIIIDSFTAYYRKELQEKKDVNSRLSRQLSILAELSREGIPVILTGQVYSTLDNRTEPVGSNMLKNWSNCIIRLENEPRIFVLEKHPDKKALSLPFDIVSKGIELSA